MHSVEKEVESMAKMRMERVKNAFTHILDIYVINVDWEKVGGVGRGKANGTKGEWAEAWPRSFETKAAFGFVEFLGIHT